MDNRMTDNEIKKALGYCLGDECHTSECCFFDEAKNDEHCYIVAIRYALDYINRLEAEKETYKDCFGKCFKDLENAHTEARKEFAKLLIDKSKNGAIHISDIPDYVKEMSGEKEK